MIQPIATLGRRLIDTAWSLLPARHGGRIMFYHSVHPSTSQSLRPEAFHEQLRWLRQHGFRDLLVSELTDERIHGLDRWVALTFDDGYRDNYEHALPILQQHGFRATFCVVADMIASTPQDSDDGSMLYPSRPMLTDADLVALTEAGMEVASHGWSHRQATEILKNDGRQALLDDLTKSKAKLEAIIDRPVTSYAYPSGQLGARSQLTNRLVRQAGYTHALSTLWGRIDSPNSTFELPRCGFAWYDDFDEFRSRILGKRDWRYVWTRLHDESQDWYH
jgi:peptidoglycan/xylan/chitin deacetylase (PgdA/CDA1 family)